MRPDMLALPVIAIMHGRPAHAANMFEIISLGNALLYTCSTNPWDVAFLI